MQIRHEKLQKYQDKLHPRLEACFPSKEPVSVSPSGCLPSDLKRPLGSNLEGTFADANKLWMMLLINTDGVGTKVHPASSQWQPGLSHCPCTDHRKRLERHLTRHQILYTCFPGEVLLLGNCLFPAPLGIPFLLQEGFRCCQKWMCMPFLLHLILLLLLILSEKPRKCRNRNVLHLWRQFQGCNSPVVAHTELQTRKKDPQYESSHLVQYV